MSWLVRGRDTSCGGFFLLIVRGVVVISGSADGATGGGGSSFRGVVFANCLGDLCSLCIKTSLNCTVSFYAQTDKAALSERRDHVL